MRHLFRMVYMTKDGSVHECEVIANNLAEAMELAGEEGICQMLQVKRTPFVDPLENADWGYLH